MNDETHLTIHFNDGQTLKLALPEQVRLSMGASAEGMKRILDADKLAIEADGRLLIIPWSSVKQIEAAPVPKSVPFGTLKNARTIP
ncbi:MAG: hypothetical protein AB9869_09215 [Verrucomicrobiia bacterium]